MEEGKQVILLRVLGSLIKGKKKPYGRARSRSCPINEPRLTLGATWKGINQLK